MDLNSSQAVAVRVTGLVNKLLQKRAPGAPAAETDQDLKTAGLSSLDMVNLMLAVEGEFDIFVPQDKMTPENFRSIAAIEALVGELFPH